MYGRSLSQLNESNARSHAGIDRQHAPGSSLETFFLSYLQTNDESDKRRDDLTMAGCDAFNLQAGWSAGKWTGVDFLYTHDVRETGANEGPK